MQAGTGIDDPVGRLVRRLQARYAGRITGGVVLPERPAQLLPLPEELDPRLAAALRTRGVQPTVPLWPRSCPFSGSSPLQDNA